MSKTKFPFFVVFTLFFQKKIADYENKHQNEFFNIIQHNSDSS